MGKEQKKTLVMVTHDEHLANYADRSSTSGMERFKIEENREKY